MSGVATTVFSYIPKDSLFTLIEYVKDFDSPGSKSDNGDVKFQVIIPF